MQETDLNQTSTHFGYDTISANEKQGKVAEVFNSVADRYDIMNDLMSMGIHRIWKRLTVHLSQVRAGHTVLDLAGGTGDLTKRFVNKVGDAGDVVLADINNAMLQEGRRRLLDQGFTGNVSFMQVNAECLPFAENTFDCVCIGFGLRNVTNQQAALESMYRVLKPGGQLLILEFSKPRVPGLNFLYDQFSFHVIPKIGRLVTGEQASYQYLVESIRMHPDQDTLKSMMQTAGFEQCQYHNFTGGIVALHKGIKV